MKKKINSFLDLERYKILREELKKNNQCSHDFIYIGVSKEDSYMIKCKCLDCGKFMDIPKEFIDKTGQTFIDKNLSYEEVKRIYNNYKIICLEDDIDSSLIGRAIIDECKELKLKRKK